MEEKDTNKENSNVTVQEVEAIPIDPLEDINYDYETSSENRNGNLNHFGNSYSRMYYNANFMPSCCSGCGLFLILLVITFISHPGAFLSALLVIAAVAILSFQVLKLALISRNGLWKVFILPPLCLCAIYWLGVMLHKQFLTPTDILLGTVITYAILSFFGFPPRH